MRKSVLIIVYIFLLSNTVCSTLAEEEQVGNSSASDAEGEGLETVEVDEEREPIPLTDKPVEINIQPVTADEFSCVGIADGVQVQSNPVDCLAFYICIKESGHKIHCPKIPHQTYYNPEKRLCDNSEPDFCKKFKVQDNNVDNRGKTGDEQNYADLDADEKDDGGGAGREEFDYVQDDQDNDVDDGNGQSGSEEQDDEITFAKEEL